MNGYGDNGGPARPSRFTREFRDRVPPKDPPRRPGANDALALPTSTQRGHKTMTNTRPKFEALAGQARRELVLRILLERGPIPHADIRAAVNAEKGSTVSNTLYQLKADGKAENTDDGWQLAGAARAGDRTPPKGADTTDDPPAPQPPVTEPTGDREEETSPAAEGVDRGDVCELCGHDHDPGDMCAEPVGAAESHYEQPESTRELAERLSVAGREVIDELAPPPDDLIKIDPARVGILSDGTLILQTDDGQTIEVAMLGAMRAYKLMHTNQMWLRDLWQADGEASE